MKKYIYIIILVSFGIVGYCFLHNVVVQKTNAEERALQLEQEEQKKTEALVAAEQNVKRLEQDGKKKAEALVTAEENVKRLEQEGQKKTEALAASEENAKQLRQAVEREKKLRIQEKDEIRERVETELKLIAHAYKQGMQSIDAEALAIKTWALSGKNGTAQVAEELNSFTTKWNYTMKKDEVFQNYVVWVVGKNTHADFQCKDRLNQGIKDCLQDIAEIEADLSTALDNELHISEEDKRKLHQAISTGSVSVDDNIRNDLVGTVVSEIISTVLAPESMGLSIVIGVGVDMLISWAVDSEGKIKEKLDESITNVASVYERSFRDVMKKYLDERREQWYNTVLELVK